MSLYSTYVERIFPYIENKRGANFLKRNLKRISMSKLNKIDEKQAESIFEREWDNLIILDACRYDMFKNKFPETEERISLGSATPEFISKTFSNGNYEDVVYIAGNPFFDPEEFERLTDRPPEEVFHTVYRTYESGWSEEESTVMPECVTTDALSADKLFSEKKKIIHFLQPHYPFLESDYDTAGIRMVDNDFSQETVWELCEKQIVDSRIAIQDYNRNLEAVIQHVERLGRKLSGKTVITSDHGNLIGEGGVYGHPKGRKEEGLRKVPWHIIE